MDTQTLSPLAAAVLTRLDKMIPEVGAPTPGKYGAAAVVGTIATAEGVEAFELAIDAVDVGAPTTAAPTAAALTLAGVARMLDTIERMGGAVAPHIRAAAIAALIGGSDEPNPGTVRAIEDARAAARATLPPIQRAGAVRIKPGALAFRRV